MDSTTATSGVGPLLTLCLCCHDSPFVRSVFLELAGLCQGRRVRAVVGFTWTCENRSRQWRDFFPTIVTSDSQESRSLLVRKR